MKKINIFTVIMFLATSTLALAENHKADDNSLYGFTPSASVALTTDYVWRGVSQTANAPAIQGAFDLAHESGAYIGIWGSNVDLGPADDTMPPSPTNTTNTSLELDIYAGFANTINVGGIDVTYDIGWLRYEYPTSGGSASAGGSNFNEIYTGLSVSPLENLNLSVYLYHGVRIEQTNPGDYREMAADYTLPDELGGFTVLASAGQYDVTNGGDDYWNWKIGVSKEIAGFNMEVAYTDTDDTGAGNSTDDAKVVATISRELGADANGGLSLPDGFEASASVALTTDYVWRGVSQTANAPAIQGSVDLAHESGAYIGVWGSNVDFGDTITSLELDIYAGFANEIDLGVTAITYDLGWLRYEYPTSRGGIRTDDNDVEHSSAGDLSFNELYFGLATSPVENLNISTYWYYGLKIENTLPGEYTDMAMDYTLPESLCGITLLGNVSYYNQKSGGDDYWNWKFGAAKDLGMFNVEVAYTDTDDAVVGSTDDAKVVATVSASF